MYITLLKLERRGNFYGKGKTNADTFWKSLVRGAKEGDTLQLKHAPSEYYHSNWELEDGATKALEAARPRQDAAHLRTSEE